MEILEQLENTFSKSELELLKESPEFATCLKRIVEIENLLPSHDAADGN